MNKEKIHYFARYSQRQFVSEDRYSVVGPVYVLEFSIIFFQILDITEENVKPSLLSRDFH